MSGPLVGMFDQAIVADVLLYNSETLVLSSSALKELEGFHVEASRRLMEMRPKRIDGV